MQILLLATFSLSCAAEADLPPLEEFQVQSSLDGSQQPSRLWVPDAAETEATPLLVFLHSWSSDYRQANEKWQRAAVEQGWIYLHPNFRGVNDHPEACGSALARRDILDAMDYVLEHYQVDRTRIYLAGVSGGGHMTMLMAAYHPDRFSAASAWVGISDLEAWYKFHLDAAGKPGRYARMVAASCGGPPDTSAEVLAQYRERSAVFHLQNCLELPLDLCAGVNDGHDGSVPVSHTLNAFNRMAAARGGEVVSPAEIEQLLTQRKLASPRSSDLVVDRTFGRKLLLRRQAPHGGRVTIFDGGHESIVPAAISWLSAQRRSVEPPAD